MKQDVRIILNSLDKETAEEIYIRNPKRKKSKVKKMKNNDE